MSKKQNPSRTNEKTTPSPYKKPPQEINHIESLPVDINAFAKGYFFEYSIASYIAQYPDIAQYIDDTYVDVITPGLANSFRYSALLLVMESLNDYIPLLIAGAAPLSPFIVTIPFAIGVAYAGNAAFSAAGGLTSGLIKSWTYGNEISNIVSVVGMSAIVATGVINPVKIVLITTGYLIGYAYIPLPSPPSPYQSGVDLSSAKEEGDRIACTDTYAGVIKILIAPVLKKLPLPESLEIVANRVIDSLAFDYIFTQISDDITINEKYCTPAKLGAVMLIKSIPNHMNQDFTLQIIKEFISDLAVYISIAQTRFITLLTRNIVGANDALAIAEEFIHLGKQLMPSAEVTDTDNVTIVGETDDEL